MQRSAPVDGFSLAYERSGEGAPVVLLHGWPGDHGDWREVAAKLADGGAEVVVPDLRGFGQSDKHSRDPSQAYSAQAQADSVLALIGELSLRRPVIGGYDVGSRVAQAIAQQAPEEIAALVLAPPLPGAGKRVLGPEAVGEFWYQSFHRLGLAVELIDGDPRAVGAYLRHFWEHWSGPEYHPSAGHIDRLVSLYGPPGAFTASIAWYRAGAGTLARAQTEQPPAPDGRIGVSTIVLWPEHDPLFPMEWADRVEEFFSAVTVRALAGVGHFSPLEAPDDWVAAVRESLTPPSPAR